MISKCDDNGMTMLHHAAAHSRIEVMDILIVYRADKNIKDNNGNTPIHHAILNNEIKSITYLILNGANPNLLNNEDLAPIHLSVLKKHTEILKELIRHPEVNIDEVTSSGNNSVHFACEIDNQEALEYLLMSGAHICSPNIYGIYPVHVSIKYCNEKCLEMLVASKNKNGLSPSQILNFADKEGNVPLHTAVNTGDTKAVQMCLHYGAKIDVRQNDNSTPLHYACTKGELDIVKLMIRTRHEVKDSVLKIQDNNGQTPLHKAVMFNHVKLAEYLIEEGSNIEVTDDNGWTPLLLAASRLNMETFKSLIKYGANIYSHDKNKRNIIHLFSLNIINDKMDYFSGLEKIQASFISIINDKDNIGCTPLHYSTRRGLLRLTSIFIKLGGLCMTQNNDKDTPLHFAARYGRIHTCRRLLNTLDGIKAMNCTDSFGRLPIHAAAENGHTKIIQMLLDRGCIFHRCYHGNTPLHYAAANGHIESCQYLIEMNQSLLDNQNQEGKTALHNAAINDRANVVGLLLTHGASILKDKQGLTFFTHTLKLKNFNTAKEVVANNNRWIEIMHTMDDSGICPVIGMIKDMPNILSLAMDKCINTEGSRGQKDFKIIYNFGILQRTVATKEDLRYDPFYVVKTMVDLNRMDLLMHPLSTAYLKMKWERFGRWVQYFIMLLYIIFLFALSFSTYTITFSALSHIDKYLNNSENCSNIDIMYGHQTEKTVLLTMAIIMLCYSIGSLIKEILQIFTKTWMYFTVFQNYMSLILHISTIILSTYIIQMDINHTTMQVAAISIFLGWFNLLLLLFHFERIGLFVIMFVQILKTVLMVLAIFSILFIGFGFAFVILFKAPINNDILMNQPLFNQCYKAYSSNKLEPAIRVWQQLPSGIMKAVVMMMGEIEFLNTYVTPLNDDDVYTLHYPILTYLFLLIFIIFMSLLLMNLLIGLAVGDIEAVQKNANLKRISLQVSWLSEFEGKLPMKIRNWVFKEIWEVYPFRCPLENIGSSEAQVIYKKNDNEECKDLANLFESLNIHEKQLYNLMLDSQQQTDLLKLILQKMEMDPDAEISDNVLPEMAGFSKNWKTVIAAKNIICKMQKPVKTGEKKL